MSLILIFDEPEDEVHCDVCYETFLLPLSIIEEMEENERITCSRCKCELMYSARLKRLAEQHQPEVALTPPVCECGFAIAECHAETCGPRNTKTSLRQGKLF